MGKQYAQRDIEAISTFYVTHVEAMTAEGLHLKADIAAELAWRDEQVDRWRDLCLRLARHVRNSDRMHPHQWGFRSGEILQEIRALDTAAYDARVKEPNRGEPHTVHWAMEVAKREAMLEKSPRIVLRTGPDTYFSIAANIPIHEHETPVMWYDSGGEEHHGLPREAAELRAKALAAKTNIGHVVFRRGTGWWAGNSMSFTKGETPECWYDSGGNRHPL